MDKRPVIGIMSAFIPKVGPCGSYVAGHDYVKSVTSAGGIPMLLPDLESQQMADSYAGLIDGYLSPGGADVAPHLYGEDPIRGVNHFSAETDVFEMRLIKACVAAGKPVLGICRGMQVVNVAYGGTLIQDIASQTKSVQAHMGSMDDRDEPFHWVRLKEGSLIRRLLNSEKILTNTYHHQAVKDVADGFTVTAAADDGIAEAMECAGKKILCVQFHPENLAQRFDGFLQLFVWLVKTCGTE